MGNTQAKHSTKTFLTAFVLIGIGIAFAVGGIYIGETDDAPGAALLGILIMIGMVTLGIRTIRRKCKVAKEEHIT